MSVRTTRRVHRSANAPSWYGSTVRRVGYGDFVRAGNAAAHGNGDGAMTLAGETVIVGEGANLAGTAVAQNHFPLLGKALVWFGIAATVGDGLCALGGR